MYGQAFPPTESKVHEILISFDVQHPDIVTNQFVLETGNFKCYNCCLKFNNLGGFLTKRGYMKFPDWPTFVIYYRGWQQKYYNPRKDRTYYHFLDRIGYATAENYIQTLRSMEKKDYKDYGMSRFYYMEIPMLFEVVKIYFPDRLKPKKQKEILSLKNVKKQRAELIRIIKKGVGKYKSLHKMVETRFLEKRGGITKRPYYTNELDYCMPYFRSRLPEFITLK